MSHHNTTTADEQMRVDPARAKTLIAALQSVSARIRQASQGRSVSFGGGWLFLM